MWRKLGKDTRIGTLLVKRGLISTTTLRTAVAQQRKARGLNLGQILVQQGLVTQRDIDRCLRRQARIRHVAALIACLCAPLQAVSAGGLSTSTTVERVAIVDAENYAASPQFDLHRASHREGKVNTSISRALQIGARMMLRNWVHTLRADEEDVQRESSKAQIDSRYSLRLRDDKFLIKCKFNF